MLHIIFDIKLFLVKRKIKFIINISNKVKILKLNYLGFHEKCYGRSINTKIKGWSYSISYLE